MKKTLFCLFFNLFLTVPALSLTLISDIDDTIKITNVLNPRDAVIRAALGNAAFTGMSETYRLLSSPVVYLTGSPFLFEDRLNVFIATRNFPIGPMILRGPNDFRQSILNYKIKEIENVLSQSTDEFILIGDDTQSDHTAYNAIKLKYPGRIAAIFIHQIRGIQMPEGIISFLTGYDLAEALARAGYLKPSDLALTKQSLLTEKKTNRIIPKFQICPKDYTSNDTDIQRLIRKICAQRN